MHSLENLSLIMFKFPLLGQLYYNNNNNTSMAPKSSVMKFPLLGQLYYNNNNTSMAPKSSVIRAQRYNKPESLSMIIF